MPVGSNLTRGLPPRATAGARALGWVAVVAAIAIVAGWVHLLEFYGTPGWDSALFLTIGKLMRHGLMLYRDLWDTKPPGIYVYQQLVYAVLPVAVWSLRFTDYLLYVATGVVFFRLCAIEARWPVALAATAGWLFMAHNSRFNVAGFYTEEYSSMAGIAAVAAAARYGRHGGDGWVVCSGAATALAMAFKHPGVACALPAVILLSRGRAWRALPLYAAAAAAPLLLIAGYFWLRGAWEALYDCQFAHLVVQHGIGAPTDPAALSKRITGFAVHTLRLLGPYSWLFWPALFGALVCAARPNRFRIAALAWLAADLVLVWVQRFNYEHYFIQLFASGALVAAIGAAWLLQHRAGEHWGVAGLRLTGALIAVALAWPAVRGAVAARQPVVSAAWSGLWRGPAAWPRHPGGAFERELGRYVRARTAHADRIFVFATGTPVAVYWTADRLPASRYLFSIVPRANVQRQAEQFAELERMRPAYVLVQGNPAVHYLTPYLVEHYALEEVRQDAYRVELWVRRPDALQVQGGDGLGLTPEPRAP
ncbi:MAG: hypothetical protein AB7V27_03005 [Candidatus Binatia bacterium]